MTDELETPPAPADEIPTEEPLAAGSPGLFEKLHEAQKKAERVQQRGENEFHHYTYAMAADVIAEAQSALQSAKLVAYMVPGGSKKTEITSNDNSGGLFVTLEATLVIADPDDGAKLEIPARGTGVDYPGDKALYKAMTGAAKYAYASALGIPFGDDPEDESAPSQRKAGAGATRHDDASADPATGPQKSAITRKFREANASDAVRDLVLRGIAGDPPTKRGASAILDVLMSDDDQRPLEERIEELLTRAEANLEETRPSDVPGSEPEAQADLLESRAEPVDGSKGGGS